MFMRKALKIAATTAGLAGLIFATATPAIAAQNITYTGKTSVNKQTVTFTSTIKATNRMNVSRLGICIRDSQNRNLDLPALNNGRSVTIDRYGKTLTGKLTLTPGTYKYGVCFFKDGYWYGEELYNPNTARKVTVTKAGTVTPTPTPTPTPPVPSPTPTPPTGSGQAMPTGDVISNGKTWTPVLNEDFNTSTTGDVATKYDKTFPVYPDGTGNGKYLPSKTLSTHDSMLDFNLHHEGNVDAGAAGSLIQQNGNWAYTGGRFSIRFKSDGKAEGYGAAFILWPNNENWSEGEIDFPEGELTSSTNLNQHRVGANPEQKSLMLENVSNWTDWHTATIDWIPGKALYYYMDGKLIAQETNPANVPSTPRKWIVQAASVDESANGAPDSSKGHLYIDWAVAYAMK
jgi:hypothetical protein